MAEKQIDFARCRRKSPGWRRSCSALSIVCAVIVIVILMTDFDGAFIGPWG